MPISSWPQRFRGYAAALLFVALVAIAGTPAAALAQDGYVTLRGSGAALVFDPADPGTLSNTVAMGGVPSDVAVSPDGSAAYAVVANMFVYRIVGGVRDAAPLTQLLNGLPEQIVVSPDGSKLFVANAIVRRVQVVDVATGARTNLDFPGGGSLWGIDAVSTPAGDRVYVAAPTTDELLVLDAATNALLATVPVGDFPQGVAASPLGDRVFVANYLDGTVSVIDTASNAVTNLAGVGNGPQELAASADGSRVYVTLKGDGDVAVIDATSEIVLERVDLGTAADSLHGISFSEDGTRVVVAHFGSHRISVIDAADGNTFVTSDRIATSRPRYVAFRPPAPVRPPDLPPAFNLPLCGTTFDAELGSELAIGLSVVDDNGVLVGASESPASGGVLLPSLPDVAAATVESTWRWTPTGNDAGEYRITFTADDGANPTVSCSVTVRVPKPPAPPEPPAPDKTAFRAFRLSHARLGMRGPLAHTFWFAGNFVVDRAAGDDIAPADEPVTISVEGTEWTLPAGALRSKLRGRLFQFRGNVGDTRLHVLITRRGRPGSGRYNISVIGWRGAFATVDNPLDLCLAIGDDFGCARKRGWIR
jgi:YVTN family beta-propeller protein